MFDRIWPYFGDIHRLLPPHWAGIAATVAAVVCGALIGAERKRAHKPAGVRTLILICLGSAIFTQASILIVAGDEPGDRGRIAAQVVTGIGFLGAGAIIRERGLVIGVTTGAGIWATAAVGVVLGSGHLAAGLFFALLIVAVLSAAGTLDRLVMGPCKMERLRIVFHPGDGVTKFRIQSLLDDHQHEHPAEFKPAEADRQEAVIPYCTAHRDHRTFLGPLVALSGIRHVSSG